MNSSESSKSLSSSVSVNNHVLLQFKESQGRLTGLGAVGTIAEKEWNTLLRQHKRRRGRPRTLKLPRGGASQSHDDEMILAVLMMNGSLTAQEIIERTGVSQSTVYQWLNRFIKLGLVKVTSWPHKFTIADERGKILAYDCYRALQTKVLSIPKQVKTDYIKKIKEQRRWKEEMDFVKKEMKMRSTPFLERQGLNKYLKRALFGKGH